MYFSGHSEPLLCLFYAAFGTIANYDIYWLPHYGVALHVKVLQPDCTATAEQRNEASATG